MGSFKLKRQDVGIEMDALILLRDPTTGALSARDLTGLTVHLKAWQNETDPDDPDNIVLDVEVSTPGPEVNRVRWTVAQPDIDALEPELGGSLEPTIYRAEYEFTATGYRKSSDGFEIIVARSP